MSIFHDQASLMQRARQQLHEKAVNPYAVGMAAAMEQEDDKPPLKKSTITKAHKIAKKVEKAGYEPEGEQIDEIAPLVVGGLAAAAAAPYLAKKFLAPKVNQALDNATKSNKLPLASGGNMQQLRQAKQAAGMKEDLELVDEGKADKKLPEHERSAARLKRYDNPSGALALGGGQQRARRAEHEERRGVKKEEVISHLIDNGFAETEQNALKIMENMGESWAQEIITELNRLEREQGKESGGNPDKAYQHVKKMIRGMEGKPAGQRKKVPGKKPPAAGEYGGPRSPAQKVAMRRAAKKRSDEMQSSRYD